jgi:hypothetical protein
MKIKQIYPITEAKRTPPKNIEEKDIYLFQHEYTKQIQATEIIEFEKVYVWERVFFSYVGFMENINDLYHRYGDPKGYEYKHHFTTLNKIKFFIKRHFFSKINKLEKAYWVEDNWSIGGYFHWITDVMTRILAILEIDKNAIILLSETASKIPFIVESVEKLNINAVFLDTDFTFKINQFNFVCPTASTGNYNEEIINLLREKIINTIFLEDENSKRRIYISRKKAPRRFIVNEEEVEKILLEYNFECLCFEDFTWEEQVKISMNTEILVSLHGAGLTNMIAMPLNSNIVELRKENDNQNNCYFSLASALKINYYYQLCETDNQSASTQNANFIVNTVELQTILEKIIN